MSQPETETNEPLFYIRWRNERTRETGRYDGLYPEEDANTWVKSMNADSDNQAKGLTYWKEPVTE